MSQQDASTRTLKSRVSHAFPKTVMHDVLGENTMTQRKQSTMGFKTPELERIELPEAENLQLKEENALLK